DSRDIEQRGRPTLRRLAYPCQARSVAGISIFQCELCCGRVASHRRRIEQIRTRPLPPPPMLAAKRRQLILDAVRSGRTAGVVELAQRFDVSEMTVRRDLARLALEGRLKRVHGGAVSERDEPPFEQIAVERLAEKNRIGRAAAALVDEGQTVMIDIGTTTL